ncbi:hypothetical protein B0A55_08725 [Friedmanniomyces simplex]|uniref:Uncharacterized protein n=1 Tax=Friedmanniomyces simplex TaxID=329884 RepID=A0A4U0X0X6_9PEZI|nr:hypothetical protein B0A55_08725 [Friedmanniomyces simplex]
MADDYDYEDDGYDYDDAFLYVEDEYGFVDELAESQIPDPGYAGTNHELEGETMSFDYDDYSFWDEMEYVDDAYWDAEGRGTSRQQQGKSAAEVVMAGQKKRKRVGGGLAGLVGGKKRKVSEVRGVAGRDGEGKGGVETVVYRTHGERYGLPPPALMVGRGKVYALLPDWKTRFADQDGLVKTAGMPADMRKAAEAKEEDTPPKKARLVDMLHDGEGEEEWDNEDPAAEEAEGGLEDLPALDPDMLKTILKQKLGEAGLEGIDEAAFMSSISKLLSGEATDDDATADLTNLLLGNAGGDSAVAGFLSRQGVSLDDAEEEAAEEEEEEEDSAISGLDTSPAGAGTTMQMPLHSASSNGSTRGRATRGKEKKVTFDVPSSEVEMEVKGESLDRLPTPPPNEDVTEAAPEPSVKSTAKSRATRVPITNSAATKRNSAITEAGGPNVHLNRELESEADGASDTLPAPAAAVRSRKRKAPPLTQEADAAAGMEEVGRAKKEAATRRTRSARAG